MDEALTERFSTHQGFEAQFRACLARAQASLQLFDPDFAVWPLGASDVDAALRQFLAGGGTLQLAMHRTDTISAHYPRFLRLLKDYSHAVETRITGKNLRHLTDSFCIADGRHIVRRFHCEHMRGEAVFDTPAATQLCAERFSAIWLEADPGLHATTLGL